MLIFEVVVVVFEETTELESEGFRWRFAVEEEEWWFEWEWEDRELRDMVG